MLVLGNRLANMTQAWVLGERLGNVALLHLPASHWPQLAHARACCTRLQPTALNHPLPSPPQGKVSLRQLARQWAGSYAGNALGCALGVTLLLGSGVVNSFMPGVSAVSLAKISYPLHQTFVSGLGCGLVWSANAAAPAAGAGVPTLIAAVADSL